jgi:uncharacterized membrane protein
VLVLPLPIRIDTFTLYMGLAIGFIVPAALFRLPAPKRHLVPREVRRRRAGRQARELFIEVGLHRTKARAGLLLFVSLTKRHVEIITDDGIQAQLQGNTLREGIVEVCLAQFTRGEGRTASWPRSAPAPISWPSISRAAPAAKTSFPTT